MRQPIVLAAGVLLAHPRHVVLAALVAGLLLGAAPPGWGLAAAIVAGAVPCAAARAYRAAPMLAIARGGLGLAVAAAVLGGAAFGQARLEATSGARLTAAIGHGVTARATVLEPIRERGGGPAVAKVRIAGGPLDGEVAVMRVMRGRHAGPWQVVGEIVTVSGRVAPLGPFVAYHRARGAAAAIDTTALRATGAHRGGIAGGLDAIRVRAERGLEHGLRSEDADLLRGMVLGEDERLAECRLELRRSAASPVCSCTISSSR